MICRSMEQMFTALQIITVRPRLNLHPSLGPKPEILSNGSVTLSNRLCCVQLTEYNLT